MEKLSFTNIGIEQSEEMLQQIMKEVAEDAKNKKEISKRELSEKIVRETEEAQRKYDNIPYNIA